jgi:phospholipase/carboxylesterase
VVLLHGYGANGEDLIGLAPAFAQVLPETLFLSPDAPHACAANPFGGLQWFDVWQGEGPERLAAVRRAAATVDRFLDERLAEAGLADGALALVGFSQGTMLSLQVGLRRRAACAGILGYSGRLESPDLLHAEIAQRPPVVLIHGEEDPLLPVESMDRAATTLRDNRVAVETHRRPGLGHGIDIDGIRIGAAFLTMVLAG